MPCNGIACEVTPAVQNPQKVVRAIASQPAGTRTFLMAPVAILKEVAQLLLGVDRFVPGAAFRSRPTCA